MGLRFDPVGGGQFKQALNQIIEAESQPIKSIEARKTKEEARFKLFNEFKSKFESFEKSLLDISSVKKLRELKVDLGEGKELVEISLDKEKAEPGQYQLEVDELAGRTSVITNGFTDANQPMLGSGFVLIPLEDGNSLELYLEDSDSSLKGLASKINETSKSPVRANIVQDFTNPEKPWKLMLVGKDDGPLEGVDLPEFYFPEASEDISIEDDQEASNGHIKLDGFPVEVKKNFIEDFIPGVNISLKQADNTKPFTFSVSEDIPKISEKVKNLVDNINNVLKFIIQQNTIDESTDTSSTFAGDTSLQSIEFRIRNILHKKYSIGPTQELDEDEESKEKINLTDFGIEFEKSGLIQFSENKFDSTIKKDFHSLATAISGPRGLAGSLKKLLESLTRSSDGVLRTKESAIKKKIKDMDKQIDNKTRQLDRRKQDLVEKFSRLQATLGNLQKQQQYMSAVLPGGGGNNLVSQLLG